MNNPTTAYEIIADLEGRLEKCKRTGDKLMARCPAHEDKTPSLSVTIGDTGDRVVMHCFTGCTADSVLDALGMTMRDLFATDDAWRSHITYEWLDHATGEPITQTRHASGDSKYRWPTGTKKRALVYQARHDPDATRPIVWCEGATAAIAAAAKLPVDDFDVLGFPDSTTFPNEATLAALAKGRAHLVWPDDDRPGAKVAPRLVSALRQAGATSVVVVDPERLGLTGGRGHDAAEWHHGGSPSKELRDACGAVQSADVEYEHFRSIWTWNAEPVPDVLIPGLAWRGRVSKIAAAPKLGKTSLLINGISAWQEGREFLGEQTGPKGSVLYVSETGPPVLRAWLEQYGCPPGSPIIAGGAAPVDDIAEAARKHKPDLVVVDSITDLHAASDGGNIWNAGDVRKLLQPLRELGCAVILVHHVRKSDGRSRDSGDFEASPDMNVSFDPGYKFGGETPPPGDRRLRYSGRWEEPERTLTFDRRDGYSLAEPTGGKGSTGGDGDPFTAKGPAPTMLDEKVNGYIMQHPKTTGRKIREALECHSRDLQPSLARLSVARLITSEEGPRRSILWSATTSGPTGPSPMFGPLGPLGPLNKNGGEKGTPESSGPSGPNSNDRDGGPLGPLNENGGKRVDRDQVDRPDPALAGPLDSDPLAESKTTPPHSTQGGDTSCDLLTANGQVEQEEDDGVVEHGKDCPGGCGGRGTVDGKPCNWHQREEDRKRRPIEGAPTTHTSGIKKWDDATSTWVDTLPGGDVFTVEGGIVHLSDRTTVTDGDPNIHWDMTWTDIELDQEDVVYYQ